MVFTQIFTNSFLLWFQVSRDSPSEVNRLRRERDELQSLVEKFENHLTEVWNYEILLYCCLKIVVDLVIEWYVLLNKGNDHLLKKLVIETFSFSALKEMYRDQCGCLGKKKRGYTLSRSIHKTRFSILLVTKGMLVDGFGRLVSIRHFFSVCKEI